MNRFRVMVAVAVVQLFVVGSVAFAQGPPAGRRGGSGGPGGPGLALRGLELSDVQRQQVRDIVQRHRDSVRDEIFALLTPDQLAKAKQFEADREARTKQRIERFQRRRSR